MFYWEYNFNKIGKQMTLTKEDKEELAVALLLWRDWKSQGRFDQEIVIQMCILAKRIEIYPELETMMSKLPPMQILPR